MANPTERYEVQKDGMTIGGKVYSKGSTFGYSDLSMMNREKVWESLAENDNVKTVSDSGDADVEVVPNLTDNSPSQPQGGPDAPVAGDSPEARAAKQFKNMETAGVVAQAAGVQGNTGADVEAMAQQADDEEAARGEADPNAAVTPHDPTAGEDQPTENEEETEEETAPKSGRGRRSSS